MKKLTEIEKQEKNLIVSNKGLSNKKRKAAYEEVKQDVMNPDENFDPETFDPMKNVPDYEIMKRKRVAPPNRLETMGMKPKEIMQGQMVGMYESKQDLYLTMAHYINNLLDRVEDLESRLPKR